MSRPTRIVRTEYYYSNDTDSDSESDSDDTTVILSDSETEDTDYESETDIESDSEELDDPKPYFGKGFRVYFDSHAEKKFFMRAFGFLDN